MPQGQAAVTWSEKKDVELFLTVLAVQKITMDYAAVAAAFGPNIPPSCIQSRMKVLRKKATEMECATPQDSPAKTAKKRAGPTTPTSANKKAKGKKGAVSNINNNNGNGNNNDDDDDDQQEATKNPETIHFSSDEAEITNPAPKTTNGDNDKVNGTVITNGDETTPTTSSPSKRKATAKPRAPRAPRTKSTTAKPKSKKESLSLSLVEAQDLENDGGVEMQFVKEEGIKQELDEDEDEDEDEDGLGGGGGVSIGNGNGIGIGNGIGEGQEKEKENMSNGHVVAAGGSQSFI